MPARRHQGLAIEPPPGWTERVVVAYAAPMRPGAHSANLVVMSDALRDDETLGAYVDRVVREAAARFDKFEVVERGECIVGGVRAVSCRFVLGTPIALLEQTIRVVEVRDPQRRAILFTATAPQDQAAAMNPLFDQALASVRFGEPADELVDHDPTPLPRPVPMPGPRSPH